MAGFLTAIWFFGTIAAIFFIFKPNQKWAVVANRKRAFGLAAAIFFITPILVTFTMPPPTPEEATTGNPTPVANVEDYQVVDLTSLDLPPLSATASEGWVRGFSADSYDRPNGRRISRMYYGHRTDITSHRDGWVRTNPLSASSEVWMRASDFTNSRPPEMEDYLPSEYRDLAVDDGAIGNPNEWGQTKEDIDIIWQGAKLALAGGECKRVLDSGKSVDVKDGYYLICDGMNKSFKFTKDYVGG